MVRLIMTALVLSPMGAWACDSMPAVSGACSKGHGNGLVSIALMAAVAALGVWVLRSVEKDGLAVKRTGQVVGWTLAVVGLGGFICAAVSHAMKNKPQSCHMSSGGSDMELPHGHPPVAPSHK